VELGGRHPLAPGDTHRKDGITFRIEETMLLTMTKERARVLDLRCGVGSNFWAKFEHFQTNIRCSNASLVNGSASVISTVDIFTNFLI